MPVINVEKYDKLTPEYLVRHPNLAWVTVNLTSSITLPNPLVNFTTGSPLFQMAVGRKFITNYTQIGKVRSNQEEFLNNFNSLLG